MMREDYDKFIKEFSSNKGYKVISIENEPKFYLAYAKVIDTNTIVKETSTSKLNIGVFVDVFPLDEVPVDGNSGFYKKQKALVKMLAIKYMVNKHRPFIKTIVLAIAKLMLFPFSKKLLINKIIKHASKYANKNCEYVGNMVAINYNTGDIYKKEFFKETIELPFENRKYLCPKEYDKILSNTYGDYMKLPPKEERARGVHHAFNAYWKEK